MADDVKQPDHDKDERGEKVLDLAAYLERSIKMPTVATAAPLKRVAEKKKPVEKDADKKTATKRGRRSA